MAVFNVPNYNEKDGFGMSLNIRRGNPNPLDNSSVWSSYDAAKNYAETSAVAYVGQILSVVEEIEGVLTATAYIINDEEGSLVEIGSSAAVDTVVVTGDNKTVVVAEDGTISLLGVEGLALTKENDEGEIVSVKYQPLYIDGKLTWVESSATTVEDIGLELAGLKEQFDELREDFDNLQIPENVSEFTNDANYQTESQVSAAIAAAISDINHAVFEKVDEVPFASLADTNVLYLVPNGEHHDIYVRIGDEMLKIDDTDADLSKYLTAKDLEGLVNEKTLEDYVLKSVLDTLVSKDNFDTILNENKTIIDLIVAAGKAHEHSNKSILDLITEENVEKWDAIADLFSKLSNEFSTTEDKELIINKINVNKIEGLDAKITDAIDEKLKDFNGTVLDSISINDTKLTIDENKNIDLPIASNTVLGLIYGIGSSQENKVSIEEDGTLTVNSLNVNKLVQTNNEFLVLNGGDAALSTEINN